MTAPGLLLPNRLDPSTVPERFSRRWHSGELVRLQRGAYADRDEWFAAYPSERFVAVARAIASVSGGQWFIRGTALALRGVELATVPRRIELGVLTSGARRRVAERIPYADRASAEAIWRRDHPGRGRLPVVPAIHRLFVEEDDLVEDGVAKEFGNGTLIQDLPSALCEYVRRASLGEALVVLDAVAAGRTGGAVSHAPEELVRMAAGQPSARARARHEALARLASPLAASVGESLSRAGMIRGGFQVPELQHEFRLPDGTRYFVDFYWPEAGIVGEFDGAQKYLRSRDISGKDPSVVVWEEKQREDALRRLGLDVLRLTWRDICTLGRLAEILRGAGVPSAAHRIPLEPEFLTRA